MSLKVLLADDSMTAQNMGKKILTDAGYQVIAVSNGAQALKKLASEKPDLVVLDVYMPGYSGLEVCERIKNAPDTARIPVVLCVAKMEPFKPEEGERVRADAVIVKPFEATDLVARIQELGENAKRRPRPQKAETPGPAAAPEIYAPEIEPPHPVAHVDVPQELAVEPAVGMELVTEEPVSPPAAQTFPTHFEIEHERQPIETIRDVRMQAADGLSGVFEMPPSMPQNANAVPEFEIVSKPRSSDEASADDVRGQAAEAARVEPRPEFIVDRVSVSIPLKETPSPSLPEPQAPDAPAETPTIKDFSLPVEREPAPPSFINPEMPSAGTGHTGIYEFAPPKGSLDSPTIETRTGDMRSSSAIDMVEPMVSAPQAFAHMEETGAVAVETAEESTVSAVPLPVWVAEEVALDQCELTVSLEEEMRAALASTQPGSTSIEVPLGAAAETIAAFTTEQPAATSAVEQFDDRAQVAAESRHERFDAMSDDIVCEAAPPQSWNSTPDSHAPMPEPGAMDAVASLQTHLPDFSSERTVLPDFSIPGHSFDAVPADEFGPATSAPVTIEAEMIQPEPPPPFVEAAPPVDPPTIEPQEEPVPTASVDQHPHAFGAMAQAIVESPALSSLKGPEAEPIVEAIVTRMLEQIKPELVAHVLRELEKKE